VLFLLTVKVWVIFLHTVATVDRHFLNLENGWHPGGWKLAVAGG